MSVSWLAWFLFCFCRSNIWLLRFWGSLLPTQMYSATSLSWLDGIASIVVFHFAFSCLKRKGVGWLVFIIVTELFDFFVLHAHSYFLEMLLYSSFSVLCGSLLIKHFFIGKWSPQAYCNKHLFLVSNWINKHSSSLFLSKNAIQICSPPLCPMLSLILSLNGFGRW